MIRASSLNSSRSSFFFTNFSEKVTGNVIQFCVIGKKEREREKKNVSQFGEIGEETIFR